MDRVAPQNKALSEERFNPFAIGVHEISIQEEQTTPRIVFSRIDGKAEEHSPSENSLENLGSVLIHDKSTPRKHNTTEHKPYLDSLRGPVALQYLPSAAHHRTDLHGYR